MKVISDKCLKKEAGLQSSAASENTQQGHEMPVACSSRAKAVSLQAWQRGPADPGKTHTCMLAVTLKERSEKSNLFSSTPFLWSPTLASVRGTKDAATYVPGCLRVTPLGGAGERLWRDRGTRWRKRRNCEGHKLALGVKVFALSMANPFDLWH